MHGNCIQKENKSRGSFVRKTIKRIKYLFSREDTLIHSYGNYPELKQIRKILVVKLRHLGDVLLTSPLFQTLKEAIPNATIDAYVYSEAIPILEGNPYIANLISYPQSWKKLNLFYRTSKEISLLLKIKKNRYDLVLHLTEGDRGCLAALISRARIRVGFSPKGALQRAALTHQVKHCPSPRHAVEQNLDALRKIGIFPEAKSPLYFHIPEEARKKAQLMVGCAPFTLIHPTARWLFKCWSVSKTRELIRVLLEQGRKIVITSGSSASEIQIARDIALDLNVLNLGGKTSLKELGALIQLSEQLICVDSLPLHIASALKKKVIVLFGPTSSIIWGPWENPQAKVVTMSKSCSPCGLDGCGGSKKSDCLESLAVKQVINALDSLTYGV